MAKVTIEVDTSVGSVDISVDGTKVDGINDVSIYAGENYDGELRADVRFCKSEKQGDMRVTTYYSVAKTGQIEVADPNHKVSAQINEFFKNRKK
jgi:hypothetical protein